MQNVLNKLEQKIIVFVVMSGLFIGCSRSTIAGKYRIEAIGTPGRCMYLNGNRGGPARVEAEVIAVGWDAQHIIVQQKKGSMIYYYIIDHTKDNMSMDVEEIVVGPLTEPEFVVLRKSLKVSPKLDFSRRYRYPYFSLVGW